MKKIILFFIVISIIITGGQVYAGTLHYAGSIIKQHRGLPKIAIIGVYPEHSDVFNDIGYVLHNKRFKGEHQVNIYNAADLQKTILVCKKIYAHYGKFLFFEFFHRLKTPYAIVVRIFYKTNSGKDRSTILVINPSGKINIITSTPAGFNPVLNTKILKLKSSKDLLITLRDHIVIMIPSSFRKGAMVFNVANNHWEAVSVHAANITFANINRKIIFNNLIKELKRQESLY